MQIYADRHALHRIPELEQDLPKTQAYLKEAEEQTLTRDLRQRTITLTSTVIP